MSALIAQQIGSGARQFSKEGGKLSIELFGFDFVALTIKILVFYIAAVIVDKIHFMLTSPLLNVAGTILGAFGFFIPTDKAEPDFFKKLFGEGYYGLKYWDLVRIMTLLLVVAEFYMYYETQKRLGGTVGAMTIGIFSLIIFGLSAYTFPDLINKIKKRMPNSIITGSTNTTFTTSGTDRPTRFN